MTGEFSDLVWASIAFVGSHIVIPRLLRDPLVRAIGEGPYAGLFSLISLATLVWMVMAFNASPSGGFIWYHAGMIQYVTAAVMFFALVLSVGGLIGANPASVGGKVTSDADVATGFLRITRHPFLVGVTLWSLSHLLVRGEMRAIVFFGAFGLLAIVGTYFIDIKARKRLGADWDRFAQATSVIPFLAIVQGRNRLVISELKLWRLAIGVAVFILILAFHDSVMGAYPLP